MFLFIFPILLYETSSLITQTTPITFTRLPVLHAVFFLRLYLFLPARPLAQYGLISLGYANKLTHKVEAAFHRDSISERAPTHHRHTVRLQMAESGHEDEHANLLGDEGLRPGGQVLKLGY